MVSTRASSHPVGPTMWMRWTWRDLRAHWVAVLVVALVMSIGIGVYTGLGSTATWRRQSNDASFAALGMHDLRVELSPGTFAPEGSLADAVADIEGAGSVVAVAERLVVDSQLDASSDTDSILVSARLVGTDLAEDAPVDAAWVEQGDRPVAGSSDAILEVKFADHWDLPAHGDVMVAGGTPVSYTGHGVIPEDFFYRGPEGSILGQGDLAPLYLPLAAAQEIVGRPGEVNDLVLRIDPGADRDAIQQQLEGMVDRLGVSGTVTNLDDADAVRLLYDDIENDQRVWNALAALILGASALAAFNLITRIVEAQRREIGIGMALGVSRAQLAIRPLFVGIQVAIVGTLAGVGVGLLMASAMGDLLRSFLPMPAYITDFQPDVFARGAALGLIIPILAVALPVWRAVRVQPIEAIRTGHLTAKTSRLSDWTARVDLPGSSLTQMPLRNVVRTPRRTLLTAIGVAAAISALVGTLGMLDSFGRTLDEIDAELSGDSAERALVQLDTFHEVDSEIVTTIESAPSVGTVDAALRLPVVALGDEDLDLLVEVIDTGGGGWTPTIDEQTDSPFAGLMLAEKAATDLGVDVGDTVTLRHPVRTADGFALEETPLPVSGIHANPLRTFAYLDVTHAETLGLAGMTNLLHAYPADDATGSELQRDLFGLPGVAASQLVTGISEGFDEALEQFIGFFVIAAGAVLILAILIAFNSSRITVEERRREHATMQAFGLPARSVMGVVVKESVLVGLVATVLGVLAGLLFMSWMLNSLASTTLPDLGISVYLSPTTVLIAAGVGIVAVAIAPLFLTRRIAKMNIPDTLRVME